jgi:hypothetical protein
MPRALGCLSFFYGVLLRLFPADLRTVYGGEMANIFSHLVHDEYRRRGAVGVACVSARAFGEFFTVALPRHLASDWLISASLSLIITSSVLGLLVGVMMSRVVITSYVVHACH